MTTLVSRISAPNQTAASSQIEDPDMNFSQTADFIPFTNPSPPASPNFENHARSVTRNEKTDGTSHVRGWERVKGDLENHGFLDQDRYSARDDKEHASKRKYESDTKPEHTSKKHRLDTSRRKAPWVAEMNWDRCRNVAEMLNDEVEAFVRYISPSDIEHEVRCRVVELISYTVTQAFPDAKVHPFGSFETRLYLPQGDIDLVILSESMAHSDRVAVLYSLANTLKRAHITKKVTIIAKAKVPIIKFVTNYGQFNVDVSINQGNGLNAGKIVNGFLKDLHGRGEGLVLRSLIMITKLLLSQRGLNEVFSGGLGSYSIVCLAVSFLQMHPKIRRGEINAEKSLGVLLVEFFELYGSYYNYEEVGISLRDGGTYFNKRQRGWIENASSRLCIEDPADPTNDISKGSFGIAKVRLTLAGAQGILTATAYLRAGILEARREGHFFKLRHGYDPEELSILSTIVGVTQEMIKHRRLVRDLFNKKIPQDPSRLRSPSHSEPRKGESSKALKKMPPALSRIEAAEKMISFWNDQIEKISRTGKRKAEMHQEDEEGRYAIEQRQSKKARKRGLNKNADTVYTNDEESEEEGEASDREEWAYNYTVEGSRSRKGSKVKAMASATAKIEGRRSYWLSKGSGAGDSDELDVDDE